MEEGVLETTILGDLQSFAKLIQWERVIEGTFMPELAKNLPWARLWEVLGKVPGMERFRVRN